MLPDIQYVASLDSGLSCGSESKAFENPEKLYLYIYYCLTIWSSLP